MNYKGTCYFCNSDIEHEYQVKTITENGTLEFVKCCSLEHSEKVKEDNSNLHKNRYKDIKNQSIQKLS